MRKIIALSFLLLSVSAFSQKIINKQGDFKFLKGTDKVEVLFNYSKLELLKENYPEETYISKRKEELNDKNAGVGDSWEVKWRASKKEIWEPMFLELLNKYASKGTKMGFYSEEPSSPYVMKVDVIWIYPGWDVFMMKQHAKVTTKISIYDRTNPSVLLISLDANEAPGDQFGSNYSNESRVGEGFAKTAKTIAKMIAKETK